MRLEPNGQEVHFPFLHFSSFLPGNYTSLIHQPNVLLTFWAISSQKILLIINKYVCSIIADSHRRILISFPYKHCNAVNKIMWTKYFHILYYWPEREEDLSDNFSLLKSSHDTPLPIREKQFIRPEIARTSVWLVTVLP